MPLGKPLLEALDRMGYGGIVLDESGQVVRINTAATRLLQENSSRNQQNSSASTATLKALLRPGAAPHCTLAGDTWTVIRRDDAGERPLVLHAVAVGERGSSGSTVVILVDLAVTPRPAPETLQRIFGLTPAEARLAIEITGGKSLDDIADGCHIAIATVRKQLASVFAKTYTHRQAELVGLLARVSILP